ncbi:hypothetical protein ISS07_05090 [Candidatus Woesearchaeota archaeon]|nr:hypothetical protein [Candidatus Woesearchaeota archaeon]
MEMQIQQVRLRSAAVRTPYDTLVGSDRAYVALQPIPTQLGTNVVEGARGFSTQDIAEKVLRIEDPMLIFQEKELVERLRESLNENGVAGQRYIVPTGMNGDPKTGWPTVADYLKKISPGEVTIFSPRYMERDSTIPKGAMDTTLIMLRTLAPEINFDVGFET